jgi:hypothetical protein
VVPGADLTSLGSTPIRLQAVLETNDPIYTPLLQSWSLTSAAPTAVTVSSFSGSSHLGTVQLDWETANEIGLVGFNMYRSETLDGAKQKLNVNLIPAQYPDQMLGSSYQLIDAVGQGQRYYYWLELVRTNGIELLEPLVVDADYLVRLPLMVK